MIDQHHKFRTYENERYPLVEIFRKGDLVDFSLGIVRWGLSKSDINGIKTQFPNAGFHQGLVRLAGQWFSKHPFSPPPFMKW